MDFKNYNIVQGFNLIAPAYDKVNDFMTFGLHRRWRKSFCDKALATTPHKGSLLDVATGTGDVALSLVFKRPDLKVVGIDPAEGMLLMAKKKLEKLSLTLASQLEFQLGDGRNLPFPENTFHTVTISWGIRNIKPRQEALKEIFRVLKPGGHLWVLESGRPQRRFVGTLYNSYAKLLPAIGGHFSKFKPAYQYYTKSVDETPCGAEFVAELLEQGFSHAVAQPVMGGIIYYYSAKKGLSVQ